MSNEIEIAKKKLQLNKIKVSLEEKELKILERKQDIKRIEAEADKDKELIKSIENNIMELEK